MSSLSPLESLLINRCAFPKQVNTPYGPKTVPCGKCLYCRKSHGRTLSSLIYNEMQDSNCTQFFTLTYHEKFLPRIFLRLTGNYDFPYCIPNNSLLYRCKPDYNAGTFLSKDKKSQIYFPASFEAEINHLNNEQLKITKELLDAYYETCSKDIKDNQLGILYTRDLQNFFKRLRKNLSTFTTEKIRYFALAEYGGERFRPHFHVLVFSKSLNAQQIENAVFESWHFGNIDYAGTPNDANSAANYVSSYVTSTCSTPLLLEQISKTRTFHSKHFGLGIIKNNLDILLQNPYLLTIEKPSIYKISYTTSNSNVPLLTEVSSKIPSRLELQYNIKKLYKKHNITNDTITSSIFEQILDFKVNNYVLNYLFPRPFGISRNNDYLTNLLLDSYDVFCNYPFLPNTYECYIQWLSKSIYKSTSEIYELAFGFSSSYLFKDKETPYKLIKHIDHNVLEMYLIFLKINKKFPKFRIFNQFSNLEECISTIKCIYDYLPAEYGLSIKDWSIELLSSQSIHNRLLTIYYTSKHFCINIKHKLHNTLFYTANNFNWHLYTQKRNQLEQLRQKQQLFSYFSTLEQNTVFPYECFTEDLGGNPKFAEYILPLQMTYLRNQTKHKELNNLLSPIFFDNSQLL